jgi:hypothetical protein
MRFPRMFYRTLARGLAVSRAHSMKSRAIGLSVRFLARGLKMRALIYDAMRNTQRSKAHPSGESHV